MPTSKKSSKRAVAAPPLPLSAAAATLAELVANAIQSLDALEASLDLDIVVRQNDKAQIHALNRVPLAALRLASTIVASEPGTFASFDGLGDATSYVETMARLAERIRTLGTHVDRSIRNHHAPAAQRTLVLYQHVKALGKLPHAQRMRERVEALHAAIVPTKRGGAPKQTHAQRMAKQRARRLAARLAKARALVEAHEGALAAGRTAKR